jgi:hypothetical protein
MRSGEVEGREGARKVGEVEDLQGKAGKGKNVRKIRRWGISRVEVWEKVIILA